MKNNFLRKPCVAGKFYLAAPRDLRRMIAEFGAKLSPQNVIGCILPHAGYIYSGQVAAQTLAKVKIKTTVVLLGPNHSGLGADFSLSPPGTWRTPLGDLEVDAKFSELLLEKSLYLKIDAAAHIDEHSLEVELPLMQYFKSNFKIVPLAVKTNNLASLKAVGKELAGVINNNQLNDSVLLVASSDMTHYETQESAEKKDALAIQAILKLDAQELSRLVQEFNISICGVSAVVILLEAARLLGAKKGELIKYQTSGDASGDRNSVVGYAGITIY